jgi:hypothetical protein
MNINIPNGFEAIPESKASFKDDDHNIKLN